VEITEMRCFNTY